MFAAAAAGCVCGICGRGVRIGRDVVSVVEGATATSRSDSERGYTRLGRSHIYRLVDAGLPILFVQQPCAARSSSGSSIAPILEVSPADGPGQFLVLWILYIGSVAYAPYKRG